MTHAKKIVAVVFVLSLLFPPATVSTGDTGKNPNGEVEKGVDVEMPFDSNFTAYFTYETFTEAVFQLQAQYPEIVHVYDLTTATPMGSTWQGRHVWGIKISDNVETVENESRVLIIGNHHAREWMSYEVPLYYAYFLATYYGMPATDNDGDGQINEDPMNGIDDDGDGLLDEDWDEARITFLVNHREIWIVPMLNPDGTAYDHTISSPGDVNSGWRKNCRDNNMNGEFDSSWDGVDLNRNYPYMWAHNRNPAEGEGVSISQDTSNPRSPVYHGPDDNHDDDGDATVPTPDWWNQRFGDYNGIDEDPVNGIDDDGDGLVDEDKEGGFSEPETQAIEHLVKTFDDEPNADEGYEFSTSISYHSYSALVMWPWAYTTEPAPDQGILSEMGNRCAEMCGYAAMQEASLYPTSGDLDDWLYASARILPLTIELNTAEEGGFHPPVDMIIPTCRLMLPVNLYVTEIAPIAHTARKINSPSLDISPPKIKVEEPPTVWYEKTPLKVSLSVENETHLDPATLKLYYTSNRGTAGCVNFTRSDGGKYVATIPPMEAETELRFWVSARDIYGTEVYAPTYAEANAYVVFIDYDIGRGPGSLLAMAIMILLIYGIIWGGFYRMLRIAIAAEKRKTGANTSEVAKRERSKKTSATGEGV